MRWVVEVKGQQVISLALSLSTLLLLLELGELGVDDAIARLTQTHELVALEIGEICPAGFRRHAGGNGRRGPRLIHVSGGPCLKREHSTFNMGAH